MELTLKGDYYEWYCDWCDTRNISLIHRITDGSFYCSACHKQTVYDAEQHTHQDSDVRFCPDDLLLRSMTVNLATAASLP